jgi:hypothetical protein
MSFQAKRLRVQLPCGEQTVVELEFARAVQNCAIFRGVPDTNYWPTCGDSCDVGSCGGTCGGNFWTPALLGARMVIEADELPMLRDDLHTRLEEVKKAQQALEERGATE